MPEASDKNKPMPTPLEDASRQVLDLVGALQKMSEVLTTLTNSNTPMQVVSESASWNGGGFEPMPIETVGSPRLIVDFERDGLRLVVTEEPSS